jgi:hypothetical protein
MKKDPCNISQRTFEQGIIHFSPVRNRRVLSKSHFWFLTFIRDSFENRTHSERYIYCEYLKLISAFKFIRSIPCFFDVSLAWQRLFLKAPFLGFSKYLE